MFKSLPSVTTMNKIELMKKRSLAAREERKKCQNLSVREKLRILDRIDREGVSIRRVAHECGLSDTTLRRWKRKRKQLEKFESECTGTNNKRMKTSNNSQLNEALYIWFAQNRKRGRPVSGPVLKAKAFTLNKLLGANGNDNFAASDGWLSSWKLKHGIRLPTGHLDKPSTSGSSPVADFKTEFAELELGDENLTRSQIFSCAEAVLSYKLMPNKCISVKDDAYSEDSRKLDGSTERFNTMVCSNANGTLKLPLVVIGRLAQPKSIQHIREDFLPVYYTNDRNLCLDSSIFATWFKEQFVPKVSQFLQKNRMPMKAVLLLEHSSSHLSSSSLSVGQIKAIFLPPNVTSAIQPMDQKILQNLIMRYKLKLLKSLLNAQDDGIDVTTHLKMITIRDVIYWMSSAWNEVSGDTIYRSCKELLPDVIEIEEDEDFLMQNDQVFRDILNILRRIYEYHESDEEDIKDWIIREANANEASEELSDLQIIQKVMNNPYDYDTEDCDPEIDPLVQETPIVTAADALQGIDCAIRFFEQKGIVSLNDLSVFLKAKETVLTDKINTF